MKKVVSFVKKRKIFTISIFIFVLIVTVIGVSYSYVGDLIEESQITPINVNLGSLEQFTYTKGDTLNLVSSSADLTTSTNPSVTLVAGTSVTTIDSAYNVYLSINENTFQYSDNVNKPAELLLKITDPNGVEITEVDGLTYTTSGGKSGFDITTLKSFVLIKSENPISTSDSVVGVTQEWNFEVSYVDLAIDQTVNNDKTLKAEIIMKNGAYQDTLSNLILANNGGVDATTGRYNPSRAAVSQEFYDSQTDDNKAKYEVTNGLYQATDDLGTSYFFRGNIDNNWVYFAGYYWRIVRINGDNTVRLIYSGVVPPTEATKYVMIGSGTAIYDAVFNSSYNNNAYVGYMYTVGERQGSSTSSTAKINLEDWYGGNLKYYDDLIADTIFCNDRSIYSGTGIDNSTTYYGARGRLISSLTNDPGGTGATLVCPEAADKYSVETTIGNGHLTFPVGLITADEVALAGGAWNVSNNNYYLYTSDAYWALSPYSYGIRASGFVVSSAGYLNDIGVLSNDGLRPVVSLTSEALARGSGTWYDPYVVVTD